MNSSKAALAKFVRQDSAQWSDRFFEGSDNGDEDEDEDRLFQEIRRARYRSVNPRLDVESAPGDTEAGRAPAARITDNPLTESPNSTRLSKPKNEEETETAEGHMITASYEPLSAEPSELEPLSHSSAGTGSSSQQGTAGVGPDLKLEPVSITALSTGGALGLSRDIDGRQKRKVN